MSSETATDTPAPRAQGGAGEEAVARLWERIEARQILLTASGEPVRVLFPGRRNRGPGPDFRDVVVHLGRGRVVAGDVEVHVGPEGWAAHGHGRDPAYNNVVLHVVLRAGGRTTTPLELGLDVPVMPLADQQAAAPSTVGSSPLPCVGCGERLGPARVMQVLAEAGETRFLARSRRMHREMSFAPPSEVLYRGLLEALGYAANREPFRQLALLLPYAELHRLWCALPPARQLPALQAALLEAAGWGQPALVPAEPGRRARLRPDLWRLSGLRPANHPERRLRGLAVLLDRTAPDGLASALQRTLALSESVQGLERALTVTQEGGAALIGQERARDMAVNVALPFFHALGTTRSPALLPRRALELYRAFPSLQSNQLTRAVAARLFVGGEQPKLRARELQGLLHQHRERCSLLRCSGCPLAASA